MSRLTSQDIVLSAVNGDRCWSIVLIINGYAVISKTSLLRTEIAAYIDRAGCYCRIVTVAVRCCNSYRIHSSLLSYSVLYDRLVIADCRAGAARVRQIDAHSSAFYVHVRAGASYINSISCHFS